MASDKLSSESESEEFYDAEDLTSNRVTKWVEKHECSET